MNLISKIKILEVLGKTAIGTVDLLDFIFSGAARMSKKDFRELNIRMRKRHESFDLEIIQLEEKQKFYNLLYKLQKENLVKKEKDRSNKSIWKITIKGLKKLKTRLENKKNNLPTKYKIKQSHFQKVVIFDVPEIDKEKRSWLRSVLNNLGFKMLQKSVWIGKSELPIEFLENLKKLKMLSCVKVFSIMNSGNID